MTSRCPGAYTGKPTQADAQAAADRISGNALTYRARTKRCPTCRRWHIEPDWDSRTRHKKDTP